MTALQKDNGKVGGIVAGIVVRRLACRAVAMHFSSAFMAATAPFQSASQTRAGTKALAHAMRCLTDTDDEATIVSLDGVWGL